MRIEFDGFGMPEPDGEWEYDLDDHAVWYDTNPLWPFARYLQDFHRKGQRELTSVRFAPDNDYSSCRNLYLVVYPDVEKRRAWGIVGLAVRPQGLGYWVADAHFSIDLVTLTGALDFEIDREHEHGPGMQAKIDKACRAIAWHKVQATQGVQQPVTAHDKYMTART